MRLILGQKIAEGGQNNIFQAQDLNSRKYYVVKAAKSQTNPKYSALLKKEFQIMSEDLKGLDYIVRPVMLSRDLVCPIDYSRDIEYIEDFMVMEHAGYGSLQELIQYTKCFNELTAFTVFVQVWRQLS